MKYWDKRLKGDTREKIYTVCLIDGDTETHYVQPIKSIAVLSDKLSAIEEFNSVLDHLRKYVPLGSDIDFITRYEYADRIEAKIDAGAGSEWWLILQEVIKYGYLDLSKI